MTTAPVSPLVAELITAGLRMTHATTNQLIDNLTADLAEARAELDAVRTGVNDALDGPYMPQPDTIRRALYPPKAMIDLHMESEES